MLLNDSEEIRKERVGLWSILNTLESLKTITDEEKEKMRNILHGSLLKLRDKDFWTSKEAEWESGMWWEEKKKVIKIWQELIDHLSIYLQQVRMGGGTMGHKVGSIRNQQVGLKDLFEKL